MSEVVPPAARFRVDVEALDRSIVQYDVCTCYGRDKAIALAAEVHFQRHPLGDARLFKVPAVSSLPGSTPQGHDLVDRNEW